jgi:RNA polymerase sigma factor (sigma-70 family)
VRGIVLDDGAAQDLTHKAFAKAMRSWSRLADEGNTFAWLHSIAVNIAISYWRRHRLARMLSSRLLVRGEGVVEDKSLVAAVMRRLTPQSRAVVVLHYYHRFSQEEIATMLNLPPGTVASRLAMAMQIMHRHAAVFGAPFEGQPRLSR